MKCNFCGKENTEVTIHNIKAVTISDWIAKLCTFNLIKHRLCQTCNSRIFRGLDSSK